MPSTLTVPCSTQSGVEANSVCNGPQDISYTIVRNSAGQITHINYNDGSVKTINRDVNGAVSSIVFAGTTANCTKTLIRNPQGEITAVLFS